jgi:hypothetical protein
MRCRNHPAATERECGTMTTEEREFLAMWRSLDVEQQEAVMLLLKRIGDRYEEVLSSLTDDNSSA